MFAVLCINQTKLLTKITVKSQEKEFSLVSLIGNDSLRNKQIKNSQNHLWEILNVDVTVVCEHITVMKYRPSTDYPFPGD